MNKAKQFETQSRIGGLMLMKAINRNRNEKLYQTKRRDLLNKLSKQVGLIKQI